MFRLLMEILSHNLITRIKFQGYEPPLLLPQMLWPTKLKSFTRLLSSKMHYFNFSVIFSSFFLYVYNFALFISYFFLMPYVVWVVCWYCLEALSILIWLGFRPMTSDGQHFDNFYLAIIFLRSFPAIEFHLKNMMMKWFL